ncbi:MAG: FAD-dependent oxidoreductase [Flavitalea sp.]
MENKCAFRTICTDCEGLGKTKQRLRKQVRLQYQKALDQFDKTKEGPAPVRPNSHLNSCVKCSGTGLISTPLYKNENKENYPHVAIIGAGIGGVALAVACLHRGIPFTLYERDNSFNERAQGYGLTLQQASKSIQQLGISSLKEGVVSTRHLVHTTEGKVVGEWGMRKQKFAENKIPKRTNIHIARQSLRLALLEQLNGNDKVQWGHQLLSFKENKEGCVDLKFQVAAGMKSARADLLVGTDGIRSAVRKLLISEEINPLRYLGCIVILGICPLSDIEGIESSLLDSATVFQTANGNERIYMMPYSSDSIMWQLSFPMKEADAKKLSEKGAQALKNEAYRRCQWHDPIPQILKATRESRISGYPVYDRDLLQSEWLQRGGPVTMIGDAAHPMSPFKGQGANQAILDALSLARTITRRCKTVSLWKEVGLRKVVLTEFESEMLERSAIKVHDSGEAARFLHSEIVLYEGDVPRGRCLGEPIKENKSEKKE